MNNLIKQLNTLPKVKGVSKVDYELIKDYEKVLDQFSINDKFKFQIDAGFIKCRKVDNMFWDITYEHPPKTNRITTFDLARYLAGRAYIMRGDIEMINEKFTLKEDVEMNTEINYNVGVASMLNNLIIDEMEAIDGYNNAITSLRALKEVNDVDFDNIINVLEDINAEEHVHVGQLQEALKVVSPDAEKFEDGEKEGAEQLEENMSKKNIQLMRSLRKVK